MPSLDSRVTIEYYKREVVRRLDDGGNPVDYYSAELTATEDAWCAISGAGSVVSAPDATIAGGEGSSVIVRWTKPRAVASLFTMLFVIDGIKHRALGRDFFNQRKSMIGFAVEPGDLELLPPPLPDS